MAPQLMPRSWGPGGSWGWAQEFGFEGRSRRREYITCLETLRLRVESSPLPGHPDSKHCWFLHTFFPSSSLPGSQPGVNLRGPLPSPMTLWHMATRLVLLKLHLAYASLTAWQFQWLLCVHTQSPTFFAAPHLCHYLLCRLSSITSFFSLPSYVEDFCSLVILLIVTFISSNIFNIGTAYSLRDHSDVCCLCWSGSSFVI